MTDKMKNYLYMARPSLDELMEKGVEELEKDLRNEYRKVNHYNNKTKENERRRKRFKNV